ncbi:MAG: ABC transporter permease [Clostridia bacterium]|nr:ABC transporter permease [Clostridia bacterium]
MKPTQRKDALRNIGRQKVSYLSIVIIALMGVTMFLGMNYSAAAIDTNGTTFYNDVDFRDIEIVSTRLLSQEDMDILRGIEGVRDAEGIVMTQVRVASGTARKSVNATTFSQRINRPLLVEGQLPADAGSCAVEQNLAQQMGWQVGDRIELTDAEGKQALFLTGREFTVTGIVDHPDHICDSVPDTLYVLLAPEAFDLDIFTGSYMKAELLVDAPREGSRFDDAYRSAVAAVKNRIDAISEARADIRQKEVDRQIEDAARENLTVGWEQIEEAKEGVRRIIRDKLTETLGQPWADAILWSSKRVVDLDDTKVQAVTFELTDRINANLRLSLRENVENLLASLELQEGVLKGAFFLLKGEGDYSQEAALNLLADKIMDALSDYDEKYVELASSCVAWDETHQSYLDGTLWEKIGLPGICRWIVTDTSGNMSFVQLDSSRDSIARLEMTFSLLFVVVGALVIYATVSKMIDEQRSLVGATKALGFYPREVFAKYLLFGLSGTLLGTLLGILIARFGVEPFILRGYQMYYRADITRSALTVGPTLIVMVVGALLSVCAVWVACRRLLKTPAVALLQAPAPKGRHRGASGRKQRLSLYLRLILRNIRSDLRRVTVTVVSVAGCCALVVVGFTLRHAVNGAVEHQFTDVVRYDGVFRFNSSINLTIEPMMDDALQKAGAKTCPVATMYATVQVRNLDVEELYCGDLDRIGEMFRLVDAETGAVMTPSGEGIYIPKRFSEYFGVRVGDPLNITVNATESVTVPVAGVFNNYMNRVMFMSRACYESLFSREMEPNAFLVQLNGADGDALHRQFTGMNGYEGYTVADTFRQLFETATSVMNAVVALFIFMAAVMAGVVLMNLTNIYILQKKRELTIMRVNGFTTRETIDYVLRETVATTALGILLGIGLGAVLGYAIVRTLEQPFIQFDRSVSVSASLIGMGLTVLFTVIVNVVALRKVKHLKLTDVA